MNIISNRRGQGSDTFKLLIAAVVAMVILGIVTGVFQKIWEMVTGIQCVSSPINEMTTKIQTSESGIITPTDTICMNAGAKFTAAALTAKVTNVAQLTFSCVDAAVCKNQNPLKVTSDSIEAVSNAQFKGLIDCQKQGGAASNYVCTITINNA